MKSIRSTKIQGRFNRLAFVLSMIILAMASASCSNQESTAYLVLPAPSRQASLNAPSTAPLASTPSPSLILNSASSPSAKQAITTQPAPSASVTPAPKPTRKPTAAPAPKPTIKKTAAPTARPTPKPTAPPSTGGMKAKENQMIALVNQEREKAGLPALKYDSTLRAPALKQSNDMSANNFFSHTSPTYGSFSARLAASGVKYSSAGENLAMYPSVEAAHKGLMGSSGHRANILNTGYTRIGIGIVYNESRGMYYITQWFAG